MGKKAKITWLCSACKERKVNLRVSIAFLFRATTLRVVSIGKIKVFYSAGTCKYHKWPIRTVAGAARVGMGSKKWLGLRTPTNPRWKMHPCTVGRDRLRWRLVGTERTPIWLCVCAADGSWLKGEFWVVVLLGECIGVRRCCRGNQFTLCPAVTLLLDPNSLNPDKDPDLGCCRIHLDPDPDQGIIYDKDNFLW